MRRAKTISTFLVILAGMATITASASLNQFSGRWTNTDANTPGITTLEIGVSGNSVTIHAWGKCTPQDCDWGQVGAFAYGPNVSSNLAGTAEAVTAIFQTSFSQTMLVLRAGRSGQLVGETFTRFTDNSGRSNYHNSYTFSQGQRLQRMRTVVPRLRAPQMVSPANGTSFSNYPRRTTLAWRAVPGAASYTVEVDCYQCCQTNKWCTDVGQTWKEAPGLTSTSYSFDFVGAQPGRWRVWAVDTQGRPGPKSEWWEFRYTR
jgi:hypothetical protein